MERTTTVVDDPHGIAARGEARLRAGDEALPAPGITVRDVAPGTAQFTVAPGTATTPEESP